MRRRVLAAGGMALIVMPGVLAFYSGGFFDEPRLIAALASWALFLLRRWSRLVRFRSPLRAAQPSSR